MNEEVAWPKARVLRGLVIQQLGERAGGPLGTHVSQGRTRLVPWGSERLGPEAPSPSDNKERGPETRAGEQSGSVPSSRLGPEAPRNLLTTKSAALGPRQVKSQAVSLHPGEGPRPGPVLSVDSRPRALALGRCLTCPLSPLHPPGAPCDPHHFLQGSALKPSCG